jgi:imidazoleglycerol-phosphate dehydratase
MSSLEPRKSDIERTTRETSISLSICLDGNGISAISTGNGMLNHLISQISRHGLIDISLDAKGDVDVGWHHLVEDSAICLGRAFRQALGEGIGIQRMGHALVPLDESLALVAVDLSGRGYADIDCGLENQMVETLPGEMIIHFLESFALEAKINLHARILAGKNAHHKAESIFKALAKSLRFALEIDPRSPTDIPSTKGTLGTPNV